MNDKRAGTCLDLFHILIETLMKKFAFLAVIIGQFVVFSANSINGDFRSEMNLDKNIVEEKVDRLVKQYLELDVFSGVVLIAEKGKPIYHKAFGYADRKQNIPNTLSTKFNIGSMNKTFTKIAILQLVEEGRLSLDNRLNTLLPQFSNEQYSKITVKHLLNHSAGFGDYYRSMDYFDLPENERDIQSVLQMIKDMPLLFEAGTERAYSNSGYVILGAIIEKISKKSYYQYVREHIVNPLELKNTYLSSQEKIPNKAIGYHKTMKGDLRDNSDFVEVSKPDGGFWSTAEDVMKFYREFHYGHQLLKEETKLKDEFYRLTTQHRTTGGAIPHAGGFEFFNSINLEILRDDITIVVLANMRETIAEQLGMGILSIIRGQEPEKPSLPAVENVYKAYINYGIDHIKKNFEDLTVNFHPADPKSWILNSIGYELMSEHKLHQAIELFSLNTELFPEDANVWDSLGEAYLNKGDKAKALKYYSKALDLDPMMPSAQEAVSKLSED